MPTKKPAREALDCDEALDEIDEILRQMEDRAAVPLLRATPAELMPLPSAAADFESAAWFTRKTRVPARRLREAAAKRRKTKRVRSKVVDGVVCYCVADASRWWPDDMPRASIIADARRR